MARSAVNNLFLLTDYTGRTSREDSTHMIGRYAVSPRTFWLLIGCFFPSMLLVAMTLPLLGIWSLLWVGIVYGGSFYLASARDRDGLRLHKWRSLADRKNSHENDYLMGNTVIEVGASEYSRIVRRDAPLVEVQNTKTPAYTPSVLEATP